MKEVNEVRQNVNTIYDKMESSTKEADRKKFRQKPYLFTASREYSKLLKQRKKEKVDQL